MPRSVRLRIVLALVASALAAIPASASAVPSPDVVAHSAGGQLRVNVRARGHAHRVTLFLDGRPVAVDRRAPFRFRRMATGHLQRGNHHVRATARYQGGAVVGLRTIAIRRSRARALSAPLGLKLRGVADGQNVAPGRVRLHVLPKGTVPVRRVELWTDGARRGIDDSAPYGFDWNTRRLRAGRSHTVAAIAYGPTGAAIVTSTAVVRVTRSHHPRPPRHQTPRPSTAPTAAPPGSGPAPASTSPTATPPGSGPAPKSTGPTASDPAPTSTSPTAAPPVSSPAPPASSPSSGNAPWAGGFESGSFDDWTWWKRPEFDAHEFGVVAAGTDGVPPHSGSRIAKFATTQAQVDSGMQHAKLYKEWAVRAPETGWKDDANHPLASMAATKSASGTYSAWYYLPADVQWSHAWSNIFQFKLVFPRPDGASVDSEPQWWVDLTSADAWDGMSGVQRHRRADGSLPGDKDPVLVASNWTMKRADGSPADWNARMVSPPVGRWFQISATIAQGQSIAFSLDGKPWFTGSSAEWPAGLTPTPTHKAGDLSGFIFGAGLYGGPGRLYVDDAAYAPAG